jgi:uncharacterized membrane protein YkvA (DUF1232 family)
VDLLLSILKRLAWLDVTKMIINQRDAKIGWMIWSWCVIRLPIPKRHAKGIVAALHRAVSVGVAVGVGFMLAYLALPFDVILDFIPVLQYAGIP